MSDANQTVDYEHVPAGMRMDETDVSVRAYFADMSDERLKEYNPSWTDDEVIEWDDNFRSDGALMLVCCERDVDIEEYRKVLEDHLKARGLSA